MSEKIEQQSGEEVKDLAEQYVPVKPLGQIDPQTESVLAIERELNLAKAKVSEIEAVAIDVAKIKGDSEVELRVLRETIQKQTEDAKAQIIAAIDLLGNQTKAVNEASGQIAELKNNGEQSKAQWLAALETIRGLTAAATESGNRIEAVKTGAETTQAVIAEKSSHIEGGRQHVDQVRKDIDAVLTEARLSANGAEGQHQSCQKVLENINTLYTSAQTIKANTESIMESVAKTQAQAELNASKTEGLAAIADTTKARIEEYEKRLNEFNTATEKQRQLIDDLLSGATNAGLASAYDKRGKSFKRPELVWQGVFMSSLIVITVIGYKFLEMSTGEAAKSATWGDLLRMLLHRLPFIAPLVWAAIHAVREGSMAKQMEEEYAFKSTTSMSFEGYRRQMAEAGKDATDNKALAQFLSDTIRIIASPPGKVYDKQRMDPTRGTAFAEVAAPIVKVAQQVINDK